MTPSRRHPPGFYVLWFVELWERMGYYLMRALCVLYMVERLGIPKGRALEWFGLYQGAVYLMPLGGGLLADRKLGTRRAVILGALIMIGGHLVMSVEQPGALLAAMALLALGGGLFKPNMQALLSGLYPPGDERHDRAFSLYYLAINTGALLAPLVGYGLQRQFGWGVAFGFAGVGLAVGLVVFLLFSHHLVDCRSTLTAATGVPLDPDAAEPFRPEDPPDSGRRVVAVVSCSLLAALFWAAYYADGGVITLWAKECVAGAADKAALTAAINPACILLLTMPLSWTLGAWGRRRGRAVSTALKLLLGFAVSALACSLLAMGAGGNARGVSLAWLLGYYVLITIGELFISPMGSALVAKIAPPRWKSFLIGVWYLSSCIGSTLSGELGRMWPGISHSAFFTMLLVLPLCSAVALLCGWRPLSGILEQSELGARKPPSPSARRTPGFQVIRGERRAAA